MTLHRLFYKRLFGHYALPPEVPMLGRRILGRWVGFVLLTICSATAALAQPIYNYGAAGDYSGRSGFIFIIEGILTNPRNAAGGAGG